MSTKVEFWHCPTLNAEVKIEFYGKPITAIGVSGQAGFAKTKAKLCRDACTDCGVVKKSPTGTGIVEDWSACAHPDLQKL